jgi:hypothetical protein
MKQQPFRTGDRVIVRSPAEILATLDTNGTLHGLPFMPEMLDWCGKPFRVERRVEKTCVDVAAPIYPNRRFAANDVVFLDGPRCSGDGHDGCKRGCKIFWKEAWLRPYDSADTSTQLSKANLKELQSRLTIKFDETHYFCQSTQLCKATEAFPGKKKPWMLRILFREIQNGDRSTSEIMKLLLLWSWQRLQRVMHSNQWLRGPNERTPTMSLGLQPGEGVRIKSRAEMVATLDHKRSNRGLTVCYEMTRYCEGRAEVRERVDRLIDERTGQMREIRNTVSLQNMHGKKMALSDLECLCFNQLGDCPRGELMYWREIWLERASGGDK